MKSIEDLINPLFSGINLTPEEKNSFIDTYVIGTYKNLTELLTAIKGNTPEYHKAFNDFVATTQKTFSPQEKADFENIIKQAQEKLLQDLLSFVKQELPAEDQTKLTENMKNLGI